jgi:hypothetical protein
MRVVDTSAKEIKAGYRQAMLNENGDAREQSGMAGKIVRYLPLNLSRLVKYATAIRELHLASQTG